MAGGDTGTYAIDCGLLRIGSNGENSFDFRVERTYRGSARKVAPIAVDAGCQFDQG